MTSTDVELFAGSPGGSAGRTPRGHRMETLTKQLVFGNLLLFFLA